MLSVIEFEAWFQEHQQGHNQNAPIYAETIREIVWNIPEGFKTLDVELSTSPDWDEREVLHFEGSQSLLEIGRTIEEAIWYPVARYSIDGSPFFILNEEGGGSPFTC